MGPNYGIGARLPERADGALEIAIGQSPDYTLRLVPEGVSDVAARDDSGRALYVGAYPSTDVLFVAERQRAEWFLLLRDSASPTEIAWQLTQPKGLPRIKSEPSRALVFCDKAGTARLRVPSPYPPD